MVVQLHWKGVKFLRAERVKVPPFLVLFWLMAIKPLRKPLAQLNAYPLAKHKGENEEIILHERDHLK
jgi:hypothetical protein